MRPSGMPRAWGIFPLAGWLFTDLLLAMMVIFLVASATGTAAPPPRPIPSPIPCLDRHSQLLTLSVNYGALLQGQPGAATDIQRQVRAFRPIRGRRAGLVITYGGTPDAGQGSTAVDVANRVNRILESLGKAGFVFVDTVYHDPLLYLGKDFSVVLVEIYLFAPAGKCYS